MKGFAQKRTHQINDGFSFLVTIDMCFWNDTWNLWRKNPPPENRRIQNQFQDCEVPPRVYAKWKDMYDYAQNNPEFDGAWDEWMKSRGNKYNYGTWNESLNRIVRESINRVLRRR